MVVGVVALTRWRPGRAWSLLLVGLAALALADVAYTLQATDLGLPEGPWIDPIYLIAAACLGAQAWQAKTAGLDRRSGEGRSWRELMVPAVFGAVMIGLFGLQYLSNATGLSTVLWAATMIAVIVRLAISDRENRSLLEQVRTDPLTGLNSRGALQIDLDGFCAEASEARPITLILFDLNGFKSFNDTCGHPAGDALLEELGAKLTAMVGDSGFAYRIGGDEFCVVITDHRRGLDTLLREAAIALTTRKNGVDVSASWGSVAVPAEAGTALEAMQLADVRMYAQKESRRAARQVDPLVPPLGPPGAEQPLGSRTIGA